MGTTAQNSRERRRQRRAELLERYKAESALTLDAARKFAATRPVAEQSTAIQMLTETAGKITTKTVKALEERILKGALPPPPARIAGGSPDHTLPQHPRRPGHGFSAGMVTDVEATLADVRKQQPVIFGKLLAQLGSPSAAEFAAMFLRPAMWGVPGKAGQRGQSSVLVGHLFQKICNLSPELAEAFQHADTTRHAFNETARRRRVAGLAPAEAQVAEHEFAKRDEFGPPTFYDKVRDGKGKEVTDGMHVSWNPDQEILITDAAEMKYGKRGSEEAPGQQDAALHRVKKLGLYLGTDFIPPDRIHLPILTGPLETRSTRLSGYFSGAAGGLQITPGGHVMKTVEIPAPGLRDFADALLKAWNSRVTTKKKK
jgi:hypothetical protein